MTDTEVGYKGGRIDRRGAAEREADARANRAELTKGLSPEGATRFDASVAKLGKLSSLVRRVSGDADMMPDGEQAMLSVAKSLESVFGETSVGAFAAAARERSHLGAFARGALAMVVSIGGAALAASNASLPTRGRGAAAAEAVALLDRMGIDVRDAGAVAWTDGRMHLIRSAGDPPGRVSLVSRAAFDAFVADCRDRSVPIATVTMDPERRSAFVARSVGGLLNQGPAGEPSAEYLMVGPADALALERAWHVAGQRRDGPETASEPVVPSGG